MSQIVDRRRWIAALARSTTSAHSRRNTSFPPLTAQHQRDREITDYISGIASKGRIGAAEWAPFANTLTAFVRMNEHHAAIEDTIIFPAWKRQSPSHGTRSCPISRRGKALEPGNSSKTSASHHS